MPWAPSRRTCSPRAEGGLDEPCRVVEMVAQALAPAGRLLDERVHVEGIAAHGGQEQVLVRKGAADALTEDGAVEEVLHAQAEPPGSVPIRGADAPAGGTDLGAVEACLVRPVKGDVVRHDHVRTAADPDATHVDPARREHVELGDEGDRVDDDAVADHRGDVRVEHAGRRQPQLQDLVAAHDRVAGVVAALVADDHRHLFCQEVGGLALPLVAPLEADDHRGRHQREPRTHEKTPVRWPGTWIDISRVAPPMSRRIAVVRSLGRLTGRPMRPSSAIADLLVHGPSPR